MKIFNLAEVIMNKYSDAIPQENFLVEYDPVTEESNIVMWNLPYPQPTEDEAISLATDLTLIDTKNAKKEEFSSKCNEAICGGFVSSALGAPHTYPSDDEAQRNFHSEIDRVNIDPSYTTVYFKTLDAGYLPHTKEQFFQVFIDGHTAGRQHIAKLNDLKGKLKDANTVPDVEKLIW